MEDQVLDAIVAVNDRRFIAGWNVRGQPRHQAIHLRNLVGLGGDVLLAPSADLPGVVISRLAVVAEAHRVRIHAMQPGEHRGHVGVHRGAIRRRHAGKMRLAKHAPVHTTHDEERRADHARVVAHREHRRHRHTAGERLHHAMLTIDRVRRRQQLAGGFLAQHVIALGGAQEIGRVRLAAFELTDLQGRLEARHVLDEITLERRRVDLVARANAGGLARRGLAVHAHGTAIAFPGSSGVCTGNRRAFVACSKL